MRRPLNIILDLTSRCNLRCRMCYFAATEELRFPPFDQVGPPRGAMALATFERLAGELFPTAHRVALACAAEPLVHPQIREVLAIAARFAVPDLWFPSNLMLLTAATAESIVDARVAVVGVSVDGVDQTTYEGIRVGARWDRLLDRLQLLRQVRRERRSTRPRLRLIFTWMRSNRDQLRRLPELAADLGFAELDVRFVTPTVGVDVGPELIVESRRELDAELEEVALDAVRRGLRLASFPEYRSSHRRRVLRSGLDRPEHWRHAARERANGCGYPGVTFLVRPNGSVLPCPFWQDEPIGSAPRDGLAALATAPLLGRILDGLRRGEPISSCVGCEQRRDAFYRPQLIVEAQPGEPPGHPPR